MSEFGEQFWDIVCELNYVWRLMFVLSIVLLVMLGGAMFLVEPGSASYYVSIFAAMIGLLLAAATGYIVRKCS